MQRWIMTTVSIVVGLLVAGGGVYGYREFLRPKPAPTYIPLTLRADISLEDQKFLAKQIQEKLQNDILLRQVVRYADLQNGFKQPSEDAAVEELRRRLIVEVSHVEKANGKIPAIRIGVDGYADEEEFLENATTRMMQDVWRIVGIDIDAGDPNEYSSVDEP